VRGKDNTMATNVGFIWDIDGVVVDSPHEDAWRFTATKEPWNVSELSSDFYLAYVASRPRYEGGDNILQHKGIYERLGATTAEAKKILLEQFCTEKNSLIEQLIQAGKFNLFADAITLLLRAKSMGIYQVAASASKNARGMLARISKFRILEEVGDDFGVLAEDDTLLSAFDVDACGLDADSKANMLKLAAEQLDNFSNSNLERFVVFEDAPSGIQAAKSLGYYAIGILRIGQEKDLYKAGADIVVLDLRMLKIDELL